MEIKAHAKFLRLSPRKTRMVLNTVKEKRALDAVALLSLQPQKASREIIKLLNSAMANAQHNFGISKNELVIKSISADIGPTFKRYKPRARGSADVIKRKMTHLTVILESVPGAKREIAKPKKTESEVLEKTTKGETKTEKGVTKKEKIEEKVGKAQEKMAEKPKEKETKAQKSKIKKEKAVKPEEVKKEEKITTKKKTVRFKEAEKEQKKKFIPKKESFFSGIKRFFRRKGF